MGKSRTSLSCLALVIACTGCGSAAPRAKPPSHGGAASTTASEATPPAVDASCQALGRIRSLPLLCPPRLPPGRWRPDHFLGMRGGRCTYLLSIVTHEPTSPFHIIFGGQCAPLALTVRAGHWEPIEPFREPVRTFRDVLGLIAAKPLKPGQRYFHQAVFPTVLRRVRVNRHPGLLLQMAPFPEGGLHGGHVAAVWNQHGHGYTLSMHFSERPTAATAAQEREVLEAAGAMSAAPPARQGS